MKKTSRRQFLSSAATASAAGALGGCATPQAEPVAVAAATPPAPAPPKEEPVVVAANTPARRTLGANDRIQCGFIGIGNRGGSLLDSTLTLPDVDVIAVCDIYDSARSEAQAKCAKKVADARAYVQYDEMLAKEKLDAVVIATPDHLHAPAILAALECGHDVYTEKPMTLTWQEAAAVRERVQSTGAVLQVGTQLRSMPMYQKAREVVQSGGIGKLVMVQVNRHGWGGHTRPTPPGFNQSQVRWDLFLRDTKQYAFDPQRYLNWRRYVEYSNGAAGDLMLHHLDIFHFISGCTMPPRVMSVGDIYQISDGRTCPDNISVLLEYNEKFHFNFSASFVNGHFGLFERYLGSEGSIEVRDMSDMTIYRGRRSDEKAEKVPTSGILNEPHLKDFFACMRTRKTPIAPVDAGWMGATCCHMSVLSEQSGQSAKWDAASSSVKV
ncbi:MAG: Gfo/Idh/MocA family oxidoreductase [Candidatus Hydrogenedentes bacterium]|nr:Gfo/Idh/MocA family oxidoreductase [Candidatus Hydrogenedentota bacterium]